MKPEIYILKSEELEVYVSDLGATLTKMIIHTRDGKAVDVILGMTQASDYQSPEYWASGAYLGAGIGRYANRIAKGRFVIDGKMYSLAVNNGANHLHGGLCGFDKKIWSVVERGPASLTLRYVSPDGEENYPGNMTVDICFTVSGKKLQINYRAETDQKCYVNLTHHPYFNLNPSAKDIRGHILKLFTNKYLKTEDLIPDGTFLNVSGDYDFTHPAALGGVIDHCGGLDDCFIFDSGGKIIRQAELFSPETGVKLYVCSNYPGLQVYTGRYLDVKNAKEGKYYGPYAGVALEAQYWPDSPHHPHFPDTLLEPGKLYTKTTIYGFE